MDSDSEVRLNSLLGRVDDSLPEADDAFRQGLREQSTQAFLESSPAAAEGEAVELSAPIGNGGKVQRRRFVVGLGGLAAVALAIALFVALRNGDRAPSVKKAPRLGLVLARYVNADTLQLRLTRKGKVEQVWIRQPGEMRLEETPQKYTIVRGTQQFEIDERSEKMDRKRTRFTRPELAGIDLLDLLTWANMNIDEYRSRLHDLLPDRTAVIDGHRCHRYGMSTIAEKGEARYFVAAYVDQRTHELRRLTLAFDAENDNGSEPFVQVDMIAVDRPIDEDRFVIARHLVNPRQGKIVDHQGIVTVRPVNRRRWTPVVRQLLLQQGDWVRTDVRGANAAKVQLADGSSLTLGPGTLVELVTVGRVRLIRGQAKVVPADKTSFTLVGPGPDSQKMAVAEVKLVSAEAGGLRAVKREPKWLTGFEGTTVRESLGSLVAQVDGRDVSLSVGDHKVTVDIRDQIARTTIEESFVNHTSGVLEGVFYFPLPQDASISGFGMWIGDELVEADVVEKQRAREIYETILRERRDPALLEWTGGNLFKARVYPIGARSEKRIKITYTQVLPLRGNRFRYNYSLQSELLQQTPLRELGINIRLHSSVPLAGVSCPTHSSRINHTKHSASVEFTAQKFTPGDDFECVFELDGRRPEVALIPHRRGDDGYFMLQLSPPSAEGNLQRELVPRGAPLKLLVLADTSGSLRQEDRRKQAAFVAALLTSLSPADTVNLAVCDVDTTWAFEEPVLATPANVSRLRKLLEGRRSLGWTDLHAAFRSVVKICDQATHVVYVGDGIVTSRGSRPGSFAAVAKEAFGKTGATFHAISVGNQFESVVLKAIAGLGGGSMRHIGVDEPSQVAFELLREISSPGLTDIKIEFEGLQVARVYPRRLPNIASGTQQIVLGRFLPTGEDQQGRVTVTGKLGGRSITYQSQLKIKEGEKGNSFIPRLWARMHLDLLLAQGRSPAIQADIIGLSEEYHIITPYTSLLVLESDADRERFKVKRRFQMRDGEKFFTKGREQAKYELVQQQMLRAGTWRIGLRRSILSRYATLGRGRSPGRRGVTSLASVEEGREWGLSAPNQLSAASEGDSPEDLESESQKKQSETARKATLTVSETMPGNEMMSADFGDESLGLDESEEMRQAGQSWRPASSSLEGLFRLPGETRPSAGRYLNSWFPVPSAVYRPGSGKNEWPAAAAELADRLLRVESLKKLTGGLRIQRTTEHFDVSNKRVRMRRRRLDLYSPGRWLHRWNDHLYSSQMQWLNKSERGVIDLAFKLGAQRKPTPGDRQSIPLSLSDYSIRPLYQFFATNAVVRIVDRSEKQATLIVTFPNDNKTEQRVTIDLERRVVVQRVYATAGKVTSTVRFDDFQEVAGTYWAGKEVTLDSQGRQTQRVQFTVESLTAAQFEAAFAAEFQSRGEWMIRSLPKTGLTKAKLAFLAKRATVDDLLRLISHFAASQQWQQVFSYLDELDKTGKPGVRWIRYSFLQAARRNDLFRQRLLAEADRQVAKPDEAELIRVSRMIRLAVTSLQVHEMLRLLDRLQPVYDRNPRERNARKDSLKHRADFLRRAGRFHDSLAVYRQLVEQFPDDVRLLGLYATALVTVKDFPGAFDWLEKQLARTWPAHQDETLRIRYVQLLRGQQRYATVVRVLDEGIKKYPEYSSNARHELLSALVWSDDMDRFRRTMAEWFAAARKPGPLKDSTVWQVQAAARVACGRGVHLYSYPHQFEKEWLTELAKTVRHFREHPKHAGIAHQIMSNSSFSKREVCQVLREEAAEILRTKITELPPAAISSMVWWVRSNDTLLDTEQWRELLKQVVRRWEAEQTRTSRQALVSIIIRVFAGRVSSRDTLAAARTLYQKAQPHERHTHALRLMNTLMAQSWTSELEGEAFQVLLGLQAGRPDSERLATQVTELTRLTDALVRGRHTTTLAAIEDPHAMTRRDLFQARRNSIQAARRGVAAKLSQLAKKDVPLAAWFRVEEHYLRVRLGEDIAKLTEACWDVLGSAPATLADPATNPLRARLEQRYLTTISYLAARRTQREADRSRLLAYIQKGVDQGDQEKAAVWKRAKYRLLVALDRPDELVNNLQDWLKSDQVINPWRLLLANLFAERGKIKEAIQLCESVERDDELPAWQRRQLADWYAVADRQDDYAKALVASFKVAPEWQIDNWISRRLNRWRSGNPPSEVDNRVLYAFRALFEKATSPQNYLSRLRRFYRASRDERLLRHLPDAVIGQTAVQVYPFLGRLSTVLGEIRKEATADELLEQVEVVRGRAPSPVNKRALDLLEMLVERQCSEVLNQPGPHVRAALSAMRRAFQREWTAGEYRLMANLLNSLGKISHQQLADEQLRQLAALHQKEPSGTIDRLFIARHRASALWRYDRRADATDRLEAAVAEYAGAVKEGWPATANAPLGQIVGYYETQGLHSRGEELLKRLLLSPASGTQQIWLQHRLFQLYLHALTNRGQVSLGAAQSLYQRLHPVLIAELEKTADNSFRYKLHGLLCQAYRFAFETLKVPSVGNDLKSFVKDSLPGVLKKQTGQYEYMVSTTQTTIALVHGIRDSLAFLIDRIETEPRWLRYRNQNTWVRRGYRIADIRAKLGQIGDLEPRLLKIVLDEMRRDLESGVTRNGNLYRNSQYFWTAKKANFTRLAEQVLKENAESATIVAHIAGYFYSALNECPRAIEILATAHRSGVLREPGQVLLVEYLQAQTRWGESISILEGLIQRSPGKVDYHVRLMRAYFHSQQPTRLLTQLRATDKYFREHAWYEANMIALGGVCLETKRFVESIDYYTLAIRGRQRNRKDRGLGDGTLSGYFAQVARAYSMLGETEKAVDAATSAIVSWGSRLENRSGAVQILSQVLRQAKDLDAYVANYLKVKVGQEQKDSSLMRRVIGQVFLSKRRFESARIHLQAAVQLQPHDKQAQSSLLECLGLMKDKKAEIEQLFQMINFDVRNLPLYHELSKRLSGSERDRALTSIVEAMPEEAEGHLMLAKLRESRGRWDDAIYHWSEVARIRRLEPAGLLGLADAQLRHGKLQAARRTIGRLEKQIWAERFRDTATQIRKLKERLRKKQSR